MKEAAGDSTCHLQHYVEYDNFCGEHGVLGRNIVDCFIYDIEWSLFGTPKLLKASGHDNFA